MRRSALPIVILAVLIVGGVLAWIATQRLLSARFGPAADPAPVVTETRLIDAFDRIDASGYFALEVRQGERTELTLEGSASDLQAITAAVTDRRLVLGRSGGGGIRGLRVAGAMPRVIVTTPAIDAVALAGATRLRIRGLAVPELRIAASGAAHVEAEGLKTDTLKVAGAGAFHGEFAGEAANFVLSLSGAGNVDAAQLVARAAKVSVSGAGRVFVHADQELDINLSGAGSVEYAGDPKVTQRVSGMGSVKRRSGERPDRSRTRLQAA